VPHFLRVPMKSGVRPASTGVSTSGPAETGPPTAADVHARGMELSDQGQYAEAAECFALAIAKRPGVPAFHLDLGEAYRNLGQWSRAAACCRMALSLRPDYPEAHNTLGLILQGMGNLPGAADEFRLALAS